MGTSRSTLRGWDRIGQGAGVREIGVSGAGRVGLMVALLLLGFVLMTEPPEGLSLAGWRTAGIVAVMALLWMTEAIPIPVTALLPLVLFPLFGVAPIAETAAPYANPVIYLFLGGFLLALGLQRWHLHKRVAFWIIGLTGSRASHVLAGFMAATAFVSMWINNSATTVMMLPMAVSVAALFREHLRDDSRAQEGIGLALMLGVAYASSIGGIGTLVGTAPNAFMAGFMRENYGYDIGFGQWMLMAVPLVVVGIALTHAVLARVCLTDRRLEVPGLREEVRREADKLGAWKRGEVVVAAVFCLAAILWVAQPWLKPWVPGLSDAVIGMAAGLVLFLIPVDWRRGEFVLAGRDLRELPYGVLILLGGGLSMAEMVDRTGLAAWLGTWTAAWQGWPIVLVVVLVTLAILFLTELTSNTATTATFLPVVASVAVGMGQDPFLLVLPTVMAASCAFMLPVGTPPNAIVFASGMVPLPRMARVGLLINLIFAALIPLTVLTLGAKVFAIFAGR
jgi:solute carrier family 13 (sodium-dependent dicarboxylate transporter), member 2/3/5